MGFKTDRERWQALCLRMSAAHTSFIYAVITTGIFCRPTCSARLARRANIIFFDTATDAAQAGFRACKRCKPNLTSQPAADEHRRAVVQHACEIIQGVSGNTTPEAVAKQVGLSLRYFHGIFKQVTGLTPASYAKQCRQPQATDTTVSPELAASLGASLSLSNNSPCDMPMSSTTEPSLSLDLDERYMAELASIMAQQNDHAEESHSLNTEDSTALASTGYQGLRESNMASFSGDWAVSSDEGRLDCLLWPSIWQQDGMVGLEDNLILDD